MWSHGESPPCQRKATQYMSACSKQLLTGKQLLAELFQEGARPCLGWLRNQRKKGLPTLKLGRLARYDADAVRNFLEGKNQHGNN